MLQLSSPIAGLRNPCLATKLILCLLPTALCLLFPGCNERTRSGRSSTGRSERLGQQGALLGAVASQMRDLPNANILELRPPVVMLDSTRSSDNKDVMALIGTNPDADPNLPPMFNYLSVPANNARFRSLGIRSGDIVKLYQMTAAEQREDDEAIPFEVERALDLNVAQVINDNALLIEGSLSGPLTRELRIEVWRFVDDRMEQINRTINQYILRGEPAIGWEPTPDQGALAQIVERLNQWLRGSKSTSDWKSAELIGTLPEAISKSEKLKPLLAPDALNQLAFKPADGRLLQEAVWCRDLSRWTRGTDSNRLAQVTSMFDWVVRNVQLEPDAGSLPRRPWQTLAFGRGTAAERAWVFVLLCRQANIDSAILTIPTAENGAWILVAVSLDGQLYLFDPRLGLPIPGPDGNSVATLAQLLADDALLRQLDTDEIEYPITVENLAKAIVHLVADPFSLSRRSVLVEERLAGEDAVKLSAPADAQAAKFREMKIGEVQLWPAPFEILQRQLTLERPDRARAAEEFVMFAWRPELWKARTLHFRGKKETPDESKRDVLSDPIDDHRTAQRHYMSKSVRLTDAILAQQPPEKQNVYANAKTCATYWLGLLTFDEAADNASRYENALRWLEMVPEESRGGLLWPGGVAYNSALALAKLDRVDQAIAKLKADTSAQRQGNQILARQWETTPPPSAVKPTEESGQ